MRIKLLAMGMACSLSCSVVFQDSVRSSSVYCSTSRFWYISDLVLATAYVAALAQAGGDQPALAWSPAALFVGSGLIGIYKRGNCVRFRETAPPEVWAAAAESSRRQAEADAQAQAAWEAQRQAELAAQQQQQQQQPQDPPQAPPEQQPTPEPQQPPPTYSEPSRPPPSQPPPNVTVTYERHVATDELGKSCQSQPGWPSAASCQYGAVCYANRCTVWCSSDGSCPAGYRCAFTDENPRTKLCRN